MGSTTAAARGSGATTGRCQSCPRHVRCRHELPAQRPRQAADQRRAFLGEPARNEPVERVVVDARQQFAQPVARTSPLDPKVGGLGREAVKSIMMLDHPLIIGTVLVAATFIVVMNLMIGILTPPFGVLLFITMDIARVSFGAIVRAIIPFYIPLAFVLILVTYWPDMVMFLPDFFRDRTRQRNLQAKHHGHAQQG